MSGTFPGIRLVINSLYPGYFGQRANCCFLCVDCINHLCVNEK